MPLWCGPAVRGCPYATQRWVGLLSRYGESATKGVAQKRCPSHVGPGPRAASSRAWMAAEQVLRVFSRLVFSPLIARGTRTEAMQVGSDDNDSGANTPESPFRAVARESEPTRSQYYCGQWISGISRATHRRALSFGRTVTEHRDVPTWLCRVCRARPVYCDHALAHQISAGGGRILVENPKIMKWPRFGRHPSEWPPSVRGMRDLLVVFLPSRRLRRADALAAIVILGPLGPLSIPMYFTVYSVILENPLRGIIDGHTPQ